MIPNLSFDWLGPYLPLTHGVQKFQDILGWALPMTRSTHILDIPQWVIYGCFLLDWHELRISRACKFTVSNGTKIGGPKFQKPALPRPLKFWLWLEDNFYPIGSMYSIFTYIWLMCIINVGRYTNPLYSSWDSNLHETSQSFRPVTRIKSVWKNLWLLRELSLMCFGREK